MSGVETQYVFNVQDALAFLSKNTCSLVFLDINLGNDTGVDFCREIRTSLDVPIFFISARSAENDPLTAAARTFHTLFMKEAAYNAQIALFDDYVLY